MPYRTQPPEVERPLRYSVRDGVACSVMGGAGDTYFAAFAIFLKASAAQVGVLSTLPAVIGSLAQILSAWLGRRRQARRPIIVGAAAVQAFSWLPLTFLPLLFPDYAIPLLIASVALYSLLGNLIAPQWSSLMGDLVPERIRGRYFARRNALGSMTNFATIFCAGGLLHYFEGKGETALGFVSIFMVALVARIVSVYYLNLLPDPPGNVAKLEVPHDLGWWERIRGSIFFRFAIFFALMQFATAIASPYFTVYMLRDLKLSYMEFTLLTASSIVIQFFTLSAWGRLSDAFGNRLILVVAGWCIPVLPALWLVSTEFWYLMLIQALGGFAWAGFSLSAGNFLYDVVPPEKRVTYLAMHNVLAAGAIFIGAMIGAQLGEYFTDPRALFGFSGLYAVFLISAVGRFLVATAFLPSLKEVRRTRRITAPAVVLRVTRSTALAGLMVDFTRGRRHRRHRAAASAGHTHHHTHGAAAREKA